MGSLDNSNVKLVHLDRDTELAILVFPDGQVSIRCQHSPEWVADTLGRVLESLRAHIGKS